MKTLASVAALAALMSACWAQEGLLGKKGGSSGGGTDKGGHSYGKSRSEAPTPRKSPLRDYRPGRKGGNSDLRDGRVNGGPSRSELALTAAPLWIASQDGLLGKKGGGSGGGSGGGTSGHVGGGRGGPAPSVSPRRGSSSGAQQRYGSGDDLLSNRRTPRDSRGGPVRYGTNNNLAERVRRTEPQRFDAPRFERGGLDDQVTREENIRRSYRRGYYGYGWDWRDDWFSYPHYRFGWGVGSVFSPWYWYPHLPGYLYITRISWGGSRFYLGWGATYDWGRGSRYDRYDAALDDALGDIERAWSRRDRRALDRLVPTRGRVVIDLDRGYAYTVDSEDFYDLMRDAIETTRTLGYRIVDVRYERRSARVVAEHVYEDPWGRMERATHAYILESTRRGYEISEFAIRRDRIPF